MSSSCSADITKGTVTHLATLVLKSLECNCTYPPSIGRHTSIYHCTYVRAHCHCKAAYKSPNFIPPRAAVHPR